MKVLSAFLMSFSMFCAIPCPIRFWDERLRPMMTAVLPLVAQRMSPGGVILCETHRQEEMPQEAGKFRWMKARRYGKAMVHTYRIPEEIAQRLRPGMRVQIPFGAGNTLRTGYVTELVRETSYPADRLKQIAQST